jgi:hypothetical protein
VSFEPAFSSECRRALKRRDFLDTFDRAVLEEVLLLVEWKENFLEDDADDGSVGLLARVIGSYVAGVELEGSACVRIVACSNLMIAREIENVSILLFKCLVRNLCLR